jgi:hypothetical protein
MARVPVSRLNPHPAHNRYCSQAPCGKAHRPRKAVVQNDLFEILNLRPGQTGGAEDQGTHIVTHHPGARIAIDAAGKVPFFAGTETIDMLGLTDRTIAFQPPKAVRIGHKKYDADYILSRKPAIEARERSRQHFGTTLEM